MLPKVKPHLRKKKWGMFETKLFKATNWKCIKKRFPFPTKCIYMRDICSGFDWLFVSKRKCKFQLLLIVNAKDSLDPTCVTTKSPPILSLNNFPLVLLFIVLLPPHFPFLLLSSSSLFYSLNSSLQRFI